MATPRLITLAVRFRYLTGLNGELFSNARLVGSWDGSGRFSAVWSETPMTPGRAEDGCPCFVATVNLDAGAGASPRPSTTQVGGSAGPGRRNGRRVFEEMK